MGKGGGGLRRKQQSHVDKRKQIIKLDDLQLNLTVLFLFN